MPSAGQLDPEGLEWRARHLVDAHFGAVFSFFARRVGTELARDLTAETFKEAIGAAHRFDPGRGSEVSWLFGVARHVLARYCRGERRQRAAYARLIAERMPESSDGEGAVLSGIDQELLFKAGRSLLRLPARQREALLLVAVDGLSYGDAASVLGVPEGTVRSRVSRARVRLRRAVGLPGGVPHGVETPLEGEGAR